MRRQPDIALHLKRILGILLLIAFSLYLKWFPLIGGGDFSDPLSILHHLILPAMALGLTLAAFVIDCGHGYSGVGRIRWPDRALVCFCARHGNSSVR